MPRYGNVNERRNQLHEVIRLSGMNLIIDDNDHPLIIKVASIQPARMQVYFIDNEEYFQRKATLIDKNGVEFSDNDERAIFFCRGVLETVKKLGWAPDVIHCQGWMTSLLPFFAKTVYREDPMFENTKIVYSLYDDQFATPLDSRLSEKVRFDTLTDSDVEVFKDSSYMGLTKAGIQYSDGVILGSSNLTADVLAVAEASGKPMLAYHDEDTYIEAYSDFYSEVLAENPVLTA